MPGATLAEQLDLMWSNFRTILASAGMTVDNIVRLTSYLRDASYADANAAARVAALGGRLIPTTAIVAETLVGDWLVGNYSVNPWDLDDGLPSDLHWSRDLPPHYRTLTLVAGGDRSDRRGLTGGDVWMHIVIPRAAKAALVRSVGCVRLHQVGGDAAEAAINRCPT
jgi:hypothetical protein